MLMPRIDLNLLKVFNAVMAERNVTRAATALHMTQPAVSNALNRLRTALDDPLFVKVQGGVMPTLKAELLWPTVKDVLTRLHDALGDTEFDPFTTQATLRFAMSDFVADQLLPPLTTRLQTDAPNLGIHVRPHGIGNVSSLLDRSEIDIAAGVFSNFVPTLHMLPIIRLQYVCVARKGHPSLKGKSHRDAFFQARHLVISLAGNVSLVDQELAAHGIKRDVAMTINQFSLAPRLIAESDLMCIMPEMAIHTSPYHDRLVTFPVPCRIRDRNVSLLWHERVHTDPLHRWVRELIADIFAAHRPASANLTALDADPEAGHGPD